MNKCLMIIGMHRSGTSLTTAILQKAGLFIGDDLLGEGKGNLKGHFENLDFLKFQIKALGLLSLEINGWSLQRVEDLNSEFDRLAREIVKKNSREQWGWKDPRTTFFLSYWEKIIPDAKYLFVYRNPWDVVDSLFRRSQDKFIKKDPFLAIKSWNSYNREIIEMYKKHRSESLLINIDDIVKDIPYFIQRINQEIGFSLNTQKAGEVFEQSIFTPSDEKNFRGWQVSLVMPEVIDTLNELRNLTGKSKYEIPDIGNGISMLTDWFSFRVLQKNHKRIEFLNQEILNYQKQIELLNRVH